MKKREQGNLFFTLDALVPLKHCYRKLDESWNIVMLAPGSEGCHQSAVDVGRIHPGMPADFLK